MNTPASSAISNSSSDIGNGSSPPSTPKREYQFHKTVRNTYGRAKPSTTSYTSLSSSSSSFSLDPPSSPDPWTNYSIPLSDNNSPLQQRSGRSRLSGSFSDLVSTTSDPWDTPTRGTRTLMEKLARAKLNFEDSDSDNDNIDGKSKINRSTKEERKEEEEEEEEEEDLENVFLVRNSKPKPGKLQQERDDRDTIDKDVKSPKRQTPKRKREVLETAVRQSPRLRKTLNLGQESDSDDDRNTRGDLVSLGRLSPRSLSPGSPPGSPSQRSSKRGRTTNMPVLLLSETKTSTAMAKMSNVSVITGAEKKLPQQVTLASFFTSKAGSNGTGILKGRASSTKERSAGTTNTAETNAASVIPKATNTLGRNPPTSSQEPPKKLEQLFLSFSKDRTKSNSTPLSSSASTSSKASDGATSLSNRKLAARLQGEDERLKRYHCPQCGMPYIRGQSEDEQIHDRYHRAVLGGVDYPGYKNEIVVATYSDFKVEQHHGNKNTTSIGSSSINGSGALTAASELSNSRIVMVSMSDPGKSASSLASGGSSFEKRKVKEVLQVVNKELGSVDFEPEQLDSCKVFLYVSGKKKVIGCVIAERIKQGFEIISHTNTLPPTPTSSSVSSSEFSAAPNSLSPSSTTETTSAPSSQRDDHGGEGGGSAIFCSTAPSPAICGINRIWVSAHYRRQGIASRLLDAVRYRFIYACKLQKTDLAFSQPTGDGKALARQYLGTDKFLVYVE